MIKQIGLPLRSRPILLITRMITDRIGLHSVLLPLLKLEITRIRHDNLLRHNSIFPLIVKMFSFLRIAFVKCIKIFQS